MDTNENRDLATAIKATVSDSADEDLTHLEDFVLKYPGSRWTLAVEVNRGILLYNRGYFSKALEAFQAAWESGKNEKRGPVYTPSGRAKLLADRALAEMLRMNCRIGRKDVVKDLLALMKTRIPQGVSASYYGDARDALWTMQNKPGKAFFCGPYALKSILQFQHSPKANDDFFMKTKSPDNGFSPIEKVLWIFAKIGKSGM